MNIYNTTIIFFLINLLSYKTISAQTVYYDNDSKLYGIINSTGMVVLKPTYSDMRVFENGLSKFQSNGKWGLIDEKGKVVVKPVFETTYDFGLLSDGLVAVKKNNKWGYTNLNNQMIVDFIYDWTMQFCSGIAWVKLNEKYNFIDIKGNLISDIWFEDVFISKGNSFAKASDEKNYEITSNGIKVMDSEFKMGNRMYCDLKTSNKLYRFQDNVTSLYGFKDVEKKVIIEAEFNFATEFSDGLAYVSKKSFADGKWNGKYEGSIINENGAVSFQLKQEWATLEGTDMCFHNGLLELKDTFQKDYLLVNKKGEVIIRMNQGVFGQ